MPAWWGGGRGGGLGAVGVKERGCGFYPLQKRCNVRQDSPRICTSQKSGGWNPGNFCKVLKTLGQTEREHILDF